jgi:predicted MFS family arabinose efflux permease
MRTAGKAVRAPLERATLDAAWGQLLSQMAPSIWNLVQSRIDNAISAQTYWSIDNSIFAAIDRQVGS